MKSEYIDVRGYWGVAIGYDLSPLDEYKVRSTLMQLGVRGEKLEKAVGVLFGEVNSGLCVSLPDLQMSLIYLGWQTSAEQFWDTLTHELLDHCQYAIRMYYDVPEGTEDSAWLTGFLMRKAVQQIGEPCHDN